MAEMPTTVVTVANGVVAGITVTQEVLTQVRMSLPGPPGSGVGALLKDYKILGALPDWSGAVEVDLADGNVVQPTLVGDVTAITVTGWPPAGQEGKVVFYLVQTAGLRTVTGWPAAVRWVGGSVPLMTPVEGAVDIVVLTSVDGGATVMGFYLGTAF